MGEDYDLIVAGGGSAGFGAALAAARAGLSVALLERYPMLGGTSTVAGVDCWEAVCGATGIPFDLYRRLRRRPVAVGIYRIRRHCCWPEDGFYPGGEAVPDPALRYADSLLRHADGAHDLRRDKAWCRAHWHGVVFEPEALAATMAALLDETGRVRLLLGATIVAVKAGRGSVESVRTAAGETLCARSFVDATGEALLARAAGCEVLSGRDPRARYDEPGAPEVADTRLNGATLMFRVEPRAEERVDPLPSGVPDACWWRGDFGVAAVNAHVSGALSVNMLPTMEGAEHAALGPAAAYAECRRRVLAFWHYYQGVFPEWRRYAIARIAPVVAIRESVRVAAEYMLTQHDLEAGLCGQRHEDIVAIADHPMDTHTAGGGGGCSGVRAAYGVPYRCLVPRGASNLLVAGRAAGMSALAASSCRLSRTMMQLGQAAGTACALAAERGVAVRDVSAAALRERLRAQHVQLAWPMPEDLAAYVRDEEAP